MGEALNADGQGFEVVLFVLHHQFQPGQLHQQVLEDPFNRVTAGDQQQGHLREALGRGQGLQSLRQVRKVAQDPQLAHALQAAAPPHLQAEHRQGDGGGQGAFGFAGPGGGQAHQAFVVAQERDQPVAFPEGTAAQHQALQPLFWAHASFARRASIKATPRLVPRRLAPASTRA